MFVDTSVGNSLLIFAYSLKLVILLFFPKLNKKFLLNKKIKKVKKTEISKKITVKFLSIKNNEIKIIRINKVLIIIS